MHRKISMYLNNAVVIFKARRGFNLWAKCLYFLEVCKKIYEVTTKWERGHKIKFQWLETFRKPNTVHHPIIENIICSTVSDIFWLILVYCHVTSAQMLFRKTQKRNMCKALIDSVPDEDLLFILLVIFLKGKETNASTLIRCFPFFYYYFHRIICGLISALKIIVSSHFLTIFPSRKRHEDKWETKTTSFIFFR